MRVCSGAIPTSKPITPILNQLLPLLHQLNQKLVPHQIVVVVGSPKNVVYLVVIGKPK